MASIVYEGIGEGGVLFKDSKFFVLHRVPQRDRWVTLIKQNGGEIVLLDKNADYIIADHAKKNLNPAGALSWKWIDESVKKGELQETDNYEAGPSIKTARPGGLTQPSKIGRTPFTAADDDILMKWVTKAERQGESTKGNELYKQLEAKHPHHTYQSWRDRWVKILSTRPRPSVPEDGEQSDDAAGYVHPLKAEPVLRNNTNAAASSRCSVSSETQMLPPKQIKKPAKDPLQRTSSHRPVRPVKLATGNGFTEEEDQLLLDNSEAILNLDPDQAIDAWVNWALQNSTHSAQEWRNRFKKHTRKILADQMVENDVEEDAVAGDFVEDHNRPVPVKKRPEKGQTKQKTAARVVETHNIEVELLRHPKKSSTNRQLFSKSRSKSKVVVPTEAHSRALEFRDSKESIEAPDSTGAKHISHHTTDNETEFRKELQKLADAFYAEDGFNSIEVDFHPVICGRRLSLFRLWQVVSSAEFGGFDEANGRKLWPKIAKKLNYNEYKHHDAPTELHDCYSELLVEFEEYRKALAEEQDEAESEIEMIGHLPRPRAAYVEEVEDEGEEGLFVSPSKPAFSGKRGIDRDNTPQALTNHKKPRVDKGKGRAFDTPTSQRVKEIPSTPDSQINGTAYITNMQRLLSPVVGSPAQSPTGSEKVAEMKAFVERWEALGYPKDDVGDAFHATNMIEGNVGEILESLREGRGIPNDIRGVWTDSDDERLEEEEDTPAFLTVLDKHGEGSVEKRRRYLDLYYGKDVG